MRGPNLAKLGEDVERSFPHKKIVSEFGYLAAFSNAGGLKLSDVKTTTNFTLSDLVKIRGGMGEISGSFVEALPTTEPQKYI